MAGIADRLKKEADEADAILANLGDKTPPVEPVVEPIVEPIVPVVPAAEVPPVEEPKPAEPAAPAVDAIKADLARVTAQLNDENNPTWRSRYLSLQGMFNKLNDEVKELKTKAVDTPVVAPAAKPLPSNPTLDKLKEDYGDGIVTLLQDLAKGQADVIVAEKLKGYEDRVGKIEETTAGNTQLTFFTALGNLVPDWKAINGWKEDNIPQEPKWTNFLNQIIPGTMKTYSNELNNAYSALDAQAVTAVFNLYKETIKPKEVVIPPVVPVVPTIDEHIDPGSSGGGGAPLDASAKPIYTKAEVDKFYNSIAKKSFVGTIAERDALEDKYSTAIVEGRVQ